MELLEFKSIQLSKNTAYTGDKVTIVVDLQYHGKSYDYTYPYLYAASNDKEK